MTTNVQTTSTDEIRVLEGSEIDHVSGGGFFGDLIRSAVNYVVGHPQQTVSTVRRVISWIRGLF
ncbi:MAG: hypothetical protein AB7O57_04915 [Hyphomicrobiaceae bacterium]